MRLLSLMLALTVLVWPVATGADTARRTGAQKIAFQGDIDPDSVKAFKDALSRAESHKPLFILIELNTPGGYTDPGFLMGKAIEASPYPLYCVVDGEAASMGFYVLQSCPNRLMTIRSRLMLHEPSVKLPGNSQGRWYLKSLFDELTRTNENMVTHYAKRMSMQPEGIMERIKHQDWWMNSDEALAVNAVDGAVDTVNEAYERAVIFETKLANQK